MCVYMYIRIHIYASRNADLTSTIDEETSKEVILFRSFDSASLLFIGHLFLDIFLHLCLSGWSTWKRMV
jgi:hypothetical protein